MTRRVIPFGRRTYFDGETLRDCRTKRPVSIGEARQLSDIYRPIVNGLDPAKLYEPDQYGRRIGLTQFEAETLQRAGYRVTWRDDLDELLADMNASPASHALAFIAGGLVVGLLAIAPFALGWLQ